VSRIDIFRHGAIRASCFRPSKVSRDERGWCGLRVIGRDVGGGKYIVGSRSMSEFI
jgi:hypothetical protein